MDDYRFRSPFFSKAVLDVEQELRAHAPLLDGALPVLHQITSKTRIRGCPLCNAVMFEVAPFLEFLNKMIDLAHDAFMYSNNYAANVLNYRGTYPYHEKAEWECRACGGILIPEPDGNSGPVDVWASGSTRGRSVAGLAFKHFPHLDEVRRQGYYWLFRVGSTWVALAGSKSEVLERLCLLQKDSYS